MIYKTKRDKTISVLMWGLIIVFCYVLYKMAFTESKDAIGIIASISVLYMLCSNWFNTRYIIKEETIEISYGFMKRIISIHEIKTLEKTKNVSAAPALSFKRVSIRYGKNHHIQVSPLDRDSFINDLRRKNRKIKVA